MPVVSGPPWANLAVLWSNCGAALMSMRRYPYAATFFHAAAKLVPAMPTFHRYFAVASYYSGAPSEAIDYVERMIAQFPEDTGLRDTLRQMQRAWV